VIGLAESQEPPECLVVLIGDMHSREVTTSVEPGQHDGIEAIGLPVIARLSGDEGRRNHLTGEAVIGKQALQNEAGSGSFVATSERTFCREPTKEPTDLHKVTRELYHLGCIALGRENSCRDGIGMHV
jgi:hypothetical protein